MDYLLPQSVTELGNCLFQLLATLVRTPRMRPCPAPGRLDPSPAHPTSYTYTAWPACCARCS